MCAYNLPAGVTRTQALVQSEQRMREGLQSHESLIYALRRVGSNEATQILYRLRQGEYDKASTTRLYWVSLQLLEDMGPQARPFPGKTQLTKTMNFSTQISRHPHALLSFTRRPPIAR